MTDAYFANKLRSILVDNKYDRRISGYRTGKIDVHKLSKIAVGSDRIFTHREARQNKQYSIVLCIDMSGSMQEVDKWPIAVESVMKTQRALRKNTNVEVAIVGFNLRSFLLKDFSWQVDDHELLRHMDAMFRLDDRSFDVRCLDDNGNLLYPRESIQDGTADFLGIEDSRALLSSRPGQKILIVYSDGQPSYELFKALLHMQVKKCKLDGIHVLSIGIQSSSVRYYYKQWVTIQDLAQLYPATIKLLSKNIRRG